MKRAIYTLTALLLLSAVSVHAQSRGRTRVQAPTVQRTTSNSTAESVLKKIEKLEADSKDSRRSTRPTTWIDLGKAYVEANDIYSKNLFYSMDKNSVINSYGQPLQTSPETVGAFTYEKLTYPDVDVYVYEGNVVYWIPKKELIANSLQKASEAFSKAYSLDNSTKNMVIVAQELSAVADSYKQTGANFYTAEQYIPAANNFLAAFNVLAMDPVNMYDSLTLFNAGFTSVAGGDNANGVKYLTELLSKGFENEGEVYFYLIHGYTAMGNLDEAKKMANLGISKYPTNTGLVDAATNVYVEAGEDPTTILPYIRQAVAADPNNAELHAGLGRVLDKMDDIDGAIVEFQKALSLEPDNYAHNYNTALMMIKKANIADVELRDNPGTSQADFNARLANVNAQYEKALAPLEKSHAANPREKSTVELLKNLYFRLREIKPEYMQNYEKYDALLKAN